MAKTLDNLLRWPWTRCGLCGQPRRNPLFNCADPRGFHRCSKFEEAVRKTAARIGFWYKFVTKGFMRYELCCVDGEYGVTHECARGTIEPEDISETLNSLAWNIGWHMQRGQAFVMAETWAETTAWALTQAATQVEKLQHELAEARNALAARQ